LHSLARARASFDDPNLVSHAGLVIRYPQAIWDDQLDCWISDAEVAETQYTAFAPKKGQAITARLIVRRVRDLNKKAAAGQDELFPVWRYHAIFTDSPFGVGDDPGRSAAPNEEVVAVAAYSLAEIGGQEASAALLARFPGATTTGHVGRWGEGGEAAVIAMEPMTRSSNEEVCWKAAYALGDIQSPSGLASLQRLLRGDRHSIEIFAAEAVGKISGFTLAESILSMAIREKGGGDVVAAHLHDTLSQWLEEVPPSSLTRRHAALVLLERIRCSDHLHPQDQARLLAIIARFIVNDELDRMTVSEELRSLHLIEEILTLQPDATFLARLNPLLEKYTRNARSFDISKVRAVGKAIGAIGGRAAVRALIKAIQRCEKLYVSTSDLA